jgi:hypothetical protein
MTELLINIVVFTAGSLMFGVIVAISIIAVFMQ